MQENTEICKFDEILMKMRCGINLISAIQEAMENSTCCAGDYADALYAVFYYLDSLSDEFETALCNEPSKAEKKLAGAMA